MTKRNRVFVSYSHKDIKFLERLQVHLQPFERKGLVDVWADTKILAGDDWREEIKNALNAASVAVLLVSADFLASDFITNNELPPLLKNAQTYGTRIIPVILKPCAFARTPELAKFQAINDPAKPLVDIRYAQREKVWDKIASLVLSSLESGQQDTGTTTSLVKTREKIVKKLRENQPTKIVPPTDTNLTGKRGYVPSYKNGQRVKHSLLGVGTVLNCYFSTQIDDEIVEVRFDDASFGTKELASQYARLRVLDTK